MTQWGEGLLIWGTRWSELVLVPKEETDGTEQPHSHRLPCVFSVFFKNVSVFPVGEKDTTFQQSPEVSDGASCTEEPPRLLETPFLHLGTCKSHNTTGLGGMKAGKSTRVWRNSEMQY